VNRRNLTVLALVLAVLAVPIVAHGAEHPKGEARPGFGEPHHILGAYLAAVDRSELQVFDQTLDRSMIVPTRVEFVYDLESATTVIQVYSRLKKPIRVPNREECEVRGVSAEMSADGHIVDTAAHIWIK